jgi:transposase
MASALELELESLTKWLDLPEFEVVEVRSDAEQRTRRLTIVPKMTVGLCVHCGRPCQERHECYDRKVRDLPMGSWNAELIVRLWQFRCERCEKFFMPRYQAIAEGTHATERLLARMAEMVRFSDIANAARFFAVPEKTLENWYYDYLERRKQSEVRSLKPVRSLGIDELSVKKNSGSSAPC